MRSDFSGTVHSTGSVARGLIALGMAATMLSACGKTDDASPRDVALQFYVTLEVAGVRSLHESRALAALEPYLTTDLARALSTPPAPDVDAGNVFSGLYEGHTSYVVHEAVQTGDTARVQLDFTNVDQKPAVQWTDTLVLVRQSPSWRVHDLRYGANWDFGYRGSLRAVLACLTGPDAANCRGGTSTTPPAPATNTR
jgi:hypothetical protein